MSGADVGPMAGHDTECDLYRDRGFVKIVIIYTWKIAFVYIWFIRSLLLEGSIRNVANESQIYTYISPPK